MEFSNGEYLVFIQKSDDIPDRINSKKGWLILQELKKTTITDNFNDSLLKSKINISYNKEIFKCKYISN